MSEEAQAAHDRPLGPVVEGFRPAPLPGPAVIKGRTVRLERLDPARHADAIFEAGAGADWIWDYMGNGPYASAEAYRAWADAAAAKDDPFFYAFVDKASGRALGVGSFMRIDPANAVIEIGGILMTPPLQRRTAATESIMLMVGWAFDHGYRRVEWKCDDRNAPSRAAAERYGFAFEGVFRQHMVIKGRNRDTAWYAMTDADWPAVRARWEAWLDPANFDAEGRQRRPLSGAAT